MLAGGLDMTAMHWPPVRMTAEEKVQSVLHTGGGRGRGRGGHSGNNCNHNLCHLGIFL